MKIKTNNHWRDFSYRADVPTEVLADQFDYQDPEEVFDGFFCYKGHWYHLDQFMRFGYPGAEEFQGWQASAADSFFSGVLIRLSEDGEQYQIGTYIS